MLALVRELFYGKKSNTNLCQADIYEAEGS